MVWVELTFAELWQGAQAGCYRRITSIKAGYNKNKHAEKSDWATDIDGALAEIALAKYLEIYWSASNRSFKEPDVGFWQVRSTRHDNGHLIVRPNDKDDLATKCVLAITRDNGVALVGWVTIGDARSDQFWKEDSWWVPQSSLTQF